MRSLVRRLFVPGWVGFALGLLLAGRAVAMPLDFVGSFGLQFSGNSEAAFGPVAISGTAQVSGGTLQIPAGVLSVTALTAPIAGEPRLTRLTLTAANRSGSFSMSRNAGGQVCPLNAAGVCTDQDGFNGTMVIQGMLAGTGADPFGIVLSDSSSVGVGIGGETTNPTGTRLSAHFWTTRNAEVSSDPGTGTGWGTQGSMAGSLAPGGSVTLVTPLRVELASGTPDLLGIASWQITFVPEPTTFGLLLFGGADAAAMGHRRRG